jgi:hypothetical protein
MIPTIAAAAFFAATPSTPSGYRALGAKHASHPSQFVFADDQSARNYERELKNQPFPDGTSPITLVTGINAKTRTALIAGLIHLRHGEDKPRMLICHSENSTRRHLAAAADAGMPYVWLFGDKHHSHALAVFAATHPFIRIYLMAPLPTKPSMSASIYRMSRIICLAA